MPDANGERANMLAGYSTKLLYKSTSIISGKIEKEVEVGDSNLPWDAPIIKAFLDDGDLREMTIVSTCIGFVKTLTKQFPTEVTPNG